jgi:predicted component of type VI protein secretion system
MKHTVGKQRRTYIRRSGHSDTVSYDRVDIVDLAGGGIEVARAFLAPCYDIHAASVHVDWVLPAVEVVNDQLNDLMHEAGLKKETEKDIT